MQTIQLSKEGMRAILPRAPQPVIDAFASPEGQAALDKVGITFTRNRVNYAFANVEHEVGGFTILNLTENINYSAERMAQVWPNRFGKPAATVGRAAVQRKYGIDAGWQRKAFDDIYGGRMGNRPGTSDGSRYIGRGGPQITGRDGYQAIQDRTGIPCVEHPELLALPQNQPAILAAFWDWKKLNRYADAGDFTGCVKAWNGGTNGMADRLALLKGNDPIVMRLKEVERIAPTASALPGGPPTKEPPPEVIDDATKAERNTRTAGVTGAAAGAGNEVGSATVQLDKHDSPFLPPIIGYSFLALGIVIAVVATFAIARKKAKVQENWK